MKFENNTIVVDPPKKFKKCTGTRLASILGLDRWSTPFKTWCAVTRTYEEPFIDSIYTIAGKTIEPLVIDYLNNTYFFGDIRTPTDLYGPDYFKKTFGDFYPESKVFGGMWDALVVEDGKTTKVIEIKTSKRIEDWKDGPPIYYAIQAALYAHLLGIDDVVMVASFLVDKDYEHPENFVPNAENTIMVEFKVSEKFPYFKKQLETALEWWEKHVITGISPAFDEKADETILKALRTNVVTPDTDILGIINVAEGLKAMIDKAHATVEEEEKELKRLTEMIKDYSIQKFRNDDKKISIKGFGFEWNTTKTETVEIDKERLKTDGLLEKYSKIKTGYTLKPSKIKEAK